MNGFFTSDSDLYRYSLYALFLLVFIAICIFVIWFFLNRRWPYVVKQPLTAVEKKLYARLCEALPGYIILAQVSLYGILKVETKKNYMHFFNKISQKSLDFVVCDKDFNVVAAIELDDKSHERPERIKADADKDKALLSAKVRIIRWHVKSFPSVSQIKNDVLGKVYKKP